MTDRERQTERNENEQPEIYAISRQDGGWKLTRRDLLRAAVTGATALGAAGCSSKQKEPKHSKLKKQGIHTSCGKALAHKRAVNALVISPDGKTLFSGSGPDGKTPFSGSGAEDTAIKFWSLPEGSLIKALNGFSDVNHLAVSPNGKMLVSSGGGKFIVLWSLPEGKQIKTLDGAQSQFLEGRGAEVRALAISHDGKMLFSGNLPASYYPGNSTDTGISLVQWSLPGGALVKTLAADESTICALAVSPDGKALFSGSDDTIQIWSLPEGKLLNTLEGHSDRIDTLAVSPDGKTLFSGSADKTIKQWSLPEGDLVWTLEGHEYGVTALAVTPDGKTLISASEDSTIRLWSVADGGLLKILEGHGGAVNALAVSLDGRTLFSGGEDMTIRKWSLPGGKPLGCLMDLVASPDAKGVKYKTRDEHGRTVTYTLPCGSPIPAGAVCVCNCVPGGVVETPSRPSTTTTTETHYWYPN